MQLYIIGLRQIVLIIWKMSTPCYFKSFNCPLHFSELAHWPFFYFLPSFATKNINNCILKRTLEANCTTVVTKSRFKHIDICMLCAALSRWEQAFIWVGEHLAMAPHQTSALQPRPVMVITGVNHETCMHRIGTILKVDLLVLPVILA
jgi:hypothetical protein